MKTLPAVDVVIVGGGWTGLLMAKELGSRTSLSIAVLERGGPQDTADYINDMDTEQLLGTLGYHPYPNPSATISMSYTNPDGVSRPACAYCGFCAVFGCMIGAKAQPTTVLLPVIGRHKNVAIRTGAWVHRIVHEGSSTQGRARGVTYVDASGEEIFQPAGLAFLASFVLNNSRLLLLSGIGEPYDPVTGKGTVGRNLNHQVIIPAVHIFLDKPLNRFMGAAGGVGICYMSDMDEVAYSFRDVLD